MIILYLLLLILCGCAVFSLTVNVLYWYENLNSRQRTIPLPRPGFLACVRMYLASLAGYLICVLLWPLGPFARRTPGPAALREKSALPPVILIHGLHNNASAWLYCGRFLRQAGFRTSTYGYSSLFVSVDSIVQGLDKHVRQVESYGGPPPILVGHSLGGLLARAWLLRPENWPRASGLLTLGTPHGGSKLAALSPGSLAAQITPIGGLITALCHAPHPGLRCVALASPTDEAVLPAEGLIPPQTWGLRVTRAASHHGMLYHPDVAAMIAEELHAMPGMPVSAPIDLESYP